MSPDAQASGARKYAPLPDRFPLRKGGELIGGRIAYETWGTLNEARDNAILLFTGLSPSAHAAASAADPSKGWWQQMLGPGLSIDTRKYFVICVNSLGSCFGSTGPSSIDPLTNKPYRLSFPDLSIEDIALAGFETLRTLEIDRLDTVIGTSLGGMVVPAFAAQCSGAARRLISISGTAAASPFAIALRSIQREAILSDPQWRHGEYAADAQPTAGLRLARMLGTLTYRSAAEWRERFGRAPVAPEWRRSGQFAPEFAVQSYMEAQADKFVHAFDANCYLYLSRAMDRFDLAVHGLDALSNAKLEAALIIGVETDLLFPLAEQRALASMFESAGVATTFAPLQCLEGHDSFLVDIAQFGERIRNFLASPLPDTRPRV